MHTPLITKKALILAHKASWCKRLVGYISGSKVFEGFPCTLKVNTTSKKWFLVTYNLVFAVRLVSIIKFIVQNDVEARWTLITVIFHVDEQKLTTCVHFDQQSLNPLRDQLVISPYPRNSFISWVRVACNPGLNQFR